MEVDEGLLVTPIKVVGKGLRMSWNSTTGCISVASTFREASAVAGEVVIDEVAGAKISMGNSSLVLRLGQSVEHLVGVLPVLLSMALMKIVVLRVVVAGVVYDVANVAALMIGADVGVGTFVEHLVGMVLVGVILSDDVLRSGALAAAIDEDGVADPRGGCDCR